MFKFKADYKFLEYALEGRKYAITIDVSFVDKDGKEIFIEQAVVSECTCVNNEDFEDYVESKVDYFTKQGKYLTYVQEYEDKSSKKAKIYILFVSDSDYERKNNGEVVSGYVIMNKKLYSYEIPLKDNLENTSLESMLYEHNEKWRNICMNTFKKSLRENSNYTICKC